MSPKSTQCYWYAEILPESLFSPYRNGGFVRRGQIDHCGLKNTTDYRHSLLTTHNMKPYVIGISGGSGSGKTSFIRQLRKQFTEQELCIISQDDYYLPREQQHKDPNEEYNFDLPKSFDKKKFRNDIRSLLSGETVTILEYAFNNPDAEPKILTFRPAPIIVIEGLFVLHFKKITPLLDLKIFINAKENLKVIRRILRDQEERGYPLSDVLYKYQHHVLPSFEKYILPYKEEADIVVNNNSDFGGGLEMLSGFLRDKLRSLSATLPR